MKHLNDFLIDSEIKILLARFVLLKIFNRTLPSALFAPSKFYATNIICDDALSQLYINEFEY